MNETFAMFIEYGGKSSNRSTNRTKPPAEDSTIVDSETALEMALFKMQMFGGGTISRRKKQVSA